MALHPMQTLGEPFDPMVNVCVSLLEEPRDDIAPGLVTH